MDIEKENYKEGSIEKPIQTWLIEAMKEQFKSVQDLRKTDEDLKKIVKEQQEEKLDDAIRMNDMVGKIKSLEENEKKVDSKLKNISWAITNLGKTVEDLKKIVKEQEKTIFNLKYPSVA